MEKVSVVESDLGIGSWSENKVGVNSYPMGDDLIKSGSKELEKVNKWVSNQSPIFKTLNYLPGSPSFADFHDAWDLPNAWGLNQLSIIPAYPMESIQCSIHILSCY